MLWWIVWDGDDEEDGIFFGPVREKQAAQAFVEGWHAAATACEEMGVTATVDLEPGKLVSFLDQRGRRVRGVVRGRTVTVGLHCLEVETEKGLALVAEVQRPRLEPEEEGR